jgi:hypothetical protein
MIPDVKQFEDQAFEHTNTFVDVRFCAGVVSEADSRAKAVFATG